MQNTAGENGKSKSLVETGIYLRDTYGLSIFFNGISPKLLRAAVNHSVTFFVYDFLFEKFSILFTLPVS